ncbi:MAG TPA: hypothetical protein VEZ24_09495 [Microvirga sp.]|nr:hypothetical protein [Microvirga sp.]
MPRYFFHSQNKTEFIDKEGAVFANSQDARNHAVIVAGELLKGAGCLGWQGTQLRLWVTDETGATVCTVKFDVEYD